MIRLPYQVFQHRATMLQSGTYLADLEAFIVRREYEKRTRIEFVTIDDSLPGWRELVKKYGGTCVQPIELNIKPKFPPEACQRCGAKVHKTADCPVSDAALAEMLRDDVEREVLRMKQGGCCGSPAKV